MTVLRNLLSNRCWPWSQWQKCLDFSPWLARGFKSHCRTLHIPHYGASLHIRELRSPQEETFLALAHEMHDDVAWSFSSGFLFQLRTCTGLTLKCRPAARFPCSSACSTTLSLKTSRVASIRAYRTLCSWCRATMFTTIKKPDNKEAATDGGTHTLRVHVAPSAPLCFVSMPLCLRGAISKTPQDCTPSGLSRKTCRHTISEAIL